MRIVCVDLQRDFVCEGGRHYQYRPCVPFIMNRFIPFVREHGYRIAEIVSDYRSTPPQTGVNVCVPGQWGYQSEIPADIKLMPVWVKAEMSPSWIRAGGGNPACEPGEPYPDPSAFSEWLTATIGPPNEKNPVLVIGLVLEICVLCTVQELKLRGYSVSVLFEGVDTNTGDARQKQLLFESLFPFWGQVVSWEEVRLSLQ